MRPLLSALCTRTKKPLPFEAIPGPKPSLPFVGTNWIYFPIVGHYKSMKLHEANIDKYHRYGPIMKEEYQKGRPSVTIFDPSDIKEVFMREGTCPSRPVLPYIIQHRKSDPTRYPNVGLANMMGNEWLNLRSQLAPLLLSRESKIRHIGSQNRVSTRLVNYIKNMLPSNNNKTHDLQDQHNQTSSTSPNVSQGGLLPNIQEVFYRFSMESIMNLCISQELGCLDHGAMSNGNGQPGMATFDGPMSDGEQIFQAAMSFFEAQHQLYYGPGLWKYFDTKPYKKLRESQDAIHDIASKYIDVALGNLKKRHKDCPHAEGRDSSPSFDDHLKTNHGDRPQHPCRHMREHQQSNQVHHTGDEHDSLLETLFRTNKFSDPVIKSTIVDFIGGGIYTVANTLTMALYLLASNPSVQEQLYQEIFRVFGDEIDNGRDIDIDMDKLDQLKFLKLCLKESYRLLPTIPGIARILQQDMVLSNHLVPEGTLVFCNFMVTCRLPQYFDDPDSFKPSRWERTGKSKGDLAYCLLPFGHGVRKCIGHNFAELEIYIALAKLIRTFKVRTVNSEDVKSLDLSYKFIIVPEKPVTLSFTPRSR